MSATKLLALGIVHLSGGAHGYQVRSELQSWRAEIWAKIKPGSIYHALKKAAADGFLTEHAEPGNSGPERVLYRVTARGRDEIVELVRDGLQRTHDPIMLNASIAMLPMLTRTDAIAHVNERVASLEAELVEQAKWREHPNPDIPEHVRDQAELWRSEERRVGKECRSRLTADEERKNDDAVLRAHHAHALALDDHVLELKGVGQ